MGRGAETERSTGLAEVDGVARAIAANAGVSWDGLNDYPGYGKTYWREEARALIAAIQPHAIFQEPRAGRWES